MALVQETGNQFGNGASASISFAGATVSGNAIVVAVSTYNGAAGGVHASSVTDNKGNTYTRAAAHGPVGANATAIFYAVNIAGGASHQITCAPSDDSSQFFTLAIAEFDQIATASPVDVASNGTGNSTAPSVNLATTQADTLLVGAISHDANSATTRTYTVGSGYTELHNFGNGGTAPPLLFQYKIVASAATHAFNGTLDSSVPWMVAAVALKAAGGGGTKAPPPRARQQRVVYRTVRR